MKVNENELEEFYAGLTSLLELPDDQFEVLAPGILEMFQKSVNNTADKLSIVTFMRLQGYEIDDLEGVSEQISETLEGLSLSDQKKSFFKQIVGTIIGAARDSEGVAKKYIPVAIEFCHENAQLPVYANLSDSGADVYAVEDITIKAGETIAVPTGLKVALPPGYEIQVRPRSGLSLRSKMRLSNSIGTIDSGYRGEVQVLVDNIEPKIKDITVDDEGKVTSILHGSDMHIAQGQRFCQLILSEVPKADYYQVKDILTVNELDRKGGLGSTGDS